MQRKNFRTRSTLPSIDLVSYKLLEDTIGYLTNPLSEETSARLTIMSRVEMASLSLYRLPMVDLRSVSSSWMITFDMSWNK